jgi:hypothetical protein
MMGPEGVEVRIGLPTGELSGIRIATTPLVDVQAILIPRDRLGEVMQDIDRRLAVYLLLDTAKRTFYIGRTDDAWERLSYWNYKDGEEWWGTAVVVISQTELGLSDSHIKWLEWRCITEAKEIEHKVTKAAKEIGPEVTNGRFRFQKDQRQPDEPSHGAMSGLFDSLCTLVSVLGYPVFEPLADIDRPSVQDEIFVPDSGEVFHCRGKDADATGVWVQNQFMVRKGSFARLQIAPHAKETVGRKRKPLLDAEILVEVKGGKGGKLKFARDHKFNSPSGAAAVVLGRSADGWIEWENAAGKPLDEIMPRGGNAGVAIVPIKTIPPGPHPEPKGPRPHLKELIDAGILKAGQELRKPYKDKEPLRAKLLSDGRIQFNSETYPNPSRAARAATGNSVDGWYFWQYQDKDGNWVLLDVARQEYLARKGK